MSPSTAHPVLEVNDVTVRLGGVEVLADIDLAVARGDCVGIIGPNGAGKTTLFNVISGFMPPTQGEVRLQGRRIDGVKPHRIARRGLVRTFQNVGGFGDLSVEQNLLLATRGKAPDQVERVREMLGLADSWRMLVKDCSLASRKLVGIAIAVVRAPSVLLLDEPLAGLATEDRDHVVEMIRRVHAAGTTICLIEHDIGRTRALSDRLVVLDAGRKVAEGATAELASRTDLVEAYLT
ncbi:ABC transporter ATP-binding protein [Nocardioides sp. L-11A]|uniref:ABC transporter ATP-binding protein n=1 Tax=Nocardioides sp. L-11A TaxID=3043848 RepID=UPI00249CA954|nr:ATP-binding cassette domain-containing protein [Nocardioides sp. L-11A]